VLLLVLLLVVVLLVVLLLGCKIQLFTSLLLSMQHLPCTLANSQTALSQQQQKQLMHQQHLQKQHPLLVMVRCLRQLRLTLSLHWG
jgi:hypothetical protein